MNGFKPGRVMLSTVQASQAILQGQGLGALFGATLMLDHNGIHPNL
jgi:hypothetical protein